MLLALVLGGIVIWQTRGGLAPASSSKSETVRSGNSEARQTVSLAIDLGDGKQQDFTAVAWHTGMTVADLLKSQPALTLVQKGAAEGALLTAINGIANEGIDGKNWTYDVNGQPADRSFAVYELHPGDRVLWRFGSRR